MNICSLHSNVRRCLRDKVRQEGQMEEELSFLRVFIAQIAGYIGKIGPVVERNSLLLFETKERCPPNS